MASAFNPTKLKHLLECGICLNRFQDPRVLPCLHSYCLECLKRHIATNKDKDGSFHCPQCREKCPMSAEGAAKFPKNFFVNGMKDVVPASFLQESPSEAASGPIMCTYQTEENKDEHGPAVVFCGQCDAYFCQTCQKHHKMFSVTKEHKVILLVDDAKPEQAIGSPNCELHKNQKLDQYCKTCSLPACPKCLLEKHKGHAKVELAVKEAFVKQDMLDVSALAAKRLQALQKISDELKTNEGKMEEELEQVNKNITVTADSLCELVRQHEATTLKAKVAQAREDARRHFEKASEELETLQKNVSSLMSSAETLYNAPPEQAVFTVLQGSISKQQILHQQNLPVPLVEWKLFKKSTESARLNTESLFGNLDSKVSFKPRMSHQPKSRHFTLGEILKTIPLSYRGDHIVSSITPLYTSMICVAHIGDKRIWVYSNEGKLLRKLDVPGIDNITGMTALDDTKGKLVIADNRQGKIHIVTVCENLTIIGYLSRDTSRIPHCINMNRQGQLVVGAFDKKWVGFFNRNGESISEIEVSIQHDKGALYSICQTDAGLVICDGEKGQVHFTDTSGNIIKTFIGVSCPWSVADTSWGHVLIAVGLTHELKVFTNNGGFLGNLCDADNPFMSPDCLYVDESKRLLYITCGIVGEMELRVYKFTPSDLPSPPVTHNVTKLSMDISLVEV